MMRMKAEGSIASLFYKPLCVMLLLAGLFCLIWLRSSIVSMTYSLRALEEKTMDARKDMKLLLAERANYMAVAKVSASVRESSHILAGVSGPAESGYVMPDRTKVVMVRKNNAAEPRKASLKTGDYR
jgi:hypothetical protein